MQFFVEGHWRFAAGLGEVVDAFPFGVSREDDLPLRRGEFLEALLQCLGLGGVSFGARALAFPEQGDEFFVEDVPVVLTAFTLTIPKAA